MRETVRAIPRWVRWSMVALVLLSTALYVGNLSSAGFSDYYATAVRSMAENPRALFFGAFDPNATITLDKLAGFLVPQAASVHFFGFSPTSLALPQVIEGVVTIIATFFVISRWVGAVGGLFGAIVMASTPLLASVFSHPMEDSMLTMFSVLAIAAVSHGLDGGKVRYLLLSGVFVGLGFQAKMMQAWLVLPALIVLVVIFFPGTRARKWAGLAAAGAVTIAVSLAWMTAISLVPVSERPYVDGTTNSSMFAMVFGYNGINHFIHGAFPGALDPASASASVSASHSTVAPLVIRLIGHTPLKLAFPEYATQVGWLYPLVIAGAVFGIIELRRSRRRGAAHDPLHAGVTLGVALAATSIIVLGFMSLPHTAYLGSLSFPFALLAAIGAVLLWRAFRGDSRWRFVLPAVLGAQTVWALVILGSYPAFAVWLSPPVAILGLGATAVLWVSMARHRLSGRTVTRFVGVALVAVLAAPVAWSLSTLNPPFSGSPNDAYAGPQVNSLFNPPVRRINPYGLGLDSNRVVPRTATVEDAMYDFASRHSRHSQFTIATDSWRSAAPMIMEGATGVLPLGGFTSAVETITLQRLIGLIQHGQLIYFLVTAQESKSRKSPPGLASISRWIPRHCSLVPSRQFSPAGAVTASERPDALYACR